MQKSWCYHMRVKMICDTREQSNSHILDAFNKNEIDYEVRKVNFGDYEMYCPDIDYTCSLRIERKASISELAGNLLEARDENGSNRFARELAKAKDLGIKLVIMIEEEANENWYEDILKHRYRSGLKPKSLRGMLMSLCSKYDVHIVGIPKEYAGSYIFNMLSYQMRNELKKTQRRRCYCMIKIEELKTKLNYMRSVASLCLTTQLENREAIGYYNGVAAATKTILDMIEENKGESK
ncbi:MAG: ERCC4 domain-containing protein [Peptostreptococcaceae bacterium]